MAQEFEKKQIDSKYNTGKTSPVTPNSGGSSSGFSVGTSSKYDTGRVGQNNATANGSSSFKVVSASDKFDTGRVGPGGTYNGNNDARLQQVEAEKNKALQEISDTYGNMANESDAYYQAQIDASKEWADKQSQLQQEQTDFAIEQIEQQKDQAEKDYTREQSGAYVDYQKESNKYGANAEQMASSGFANSGYSESSQVSMYNTYQSRVASARESYNQAVLNYDNAIKDARLQNNSILAEIAYNSLQQQLELGLQGFQYKNQLITEQLNKKLETDQMYHNRYQDVLDQIHKEKTLAEEIRQYNERMAEEKRQYNESLALQKAQLEEEKRQYNESSAFQREQFEYQKSQASKSSGGSGGSGGGSGGSGGSGGGNPVVGKVDDSKKVNEKLANASQQVQADAKKYDTFSNGYQPKGIGDFGNVSKTGDSVVVNGKTQNLWKTSNGMLWYWDGANMQYKRFYKESSKPSSQKGKAGAYAGGIASLLKTSSKK